MISGELTQIAQNIVRSAGLIDSGRLIDSIKIEYQVMPDGSIQFELSALYYLQYHIDQIGLIDRLTGHRSFGDLIANLMTAQVENKIATYLNTTDIGGDIDFTPRVSMNINYLNV